MPSTRSANFATRGACSESLATVLLIQSAKAFKVLAKSSAGCVVGSGARASIPACDGSAVVDEAATVTAADEEVVGVRAGGEDWGGGALAVRPTVDDVVDMLLLVVVVVVESAASDG